MFCTRNSQREGRSLPKEVQGLLFQCNVGISVGFSTETTGSLCNLESRRTPSYVSTILQHINHGFFVRFFFLLLWPHEKFELQHTLIYLIWVWLLKKKLDTLLLFIYYICEFIAIIPRMVLKILRSGLILIWQIQLKIEGQETFLGKYIKIDGVNVVL